MDSNVLAFFNNSYSRRVSSVAAIVACALCSVTQPAVCSEFCDPATRLIAIDIVTNIADDNSERLIEKFDALELFVETSADPIDAGRQFLQSFIEELNSAYDINLTMEKACVLVRENLHNFQLPIETRDILLKTISLLEPGLKEASPKVDGIKPSVNALKINLLPKWFEKTNIKPSTVPTLQMDSSDVELPADIYFGAVEIFAGVLILTLGLVYTPAVGLGLGMMGDGARRVLDGTTELGNQRRQESLLHD